MEVYRFTAAMSCYFKFSKFNCRVLGHGGYLGGHSHIKPSHSLHQNDAKLQTHPPSTVNVTMPNLPKIDVYIFKYKISVGNLVKFFFHISAYFWHIIFHSKQHFPCIAAWGTKFCRHENLFLMGIFNSRNSRLCG